jgi:hypothetical protein
VVAGLADSAAAGSEYFLDISYGSRLIGNATAPCGRNSDPMIHRVVL